MKIKFSFFLLIFCFIIAGTSFSQSDTDSRKLPFILEGKDTIPVVNLPVVNVVDFGKNGMTDMQAYYRLRFNVIKVYPYAKLASIKMNELKEHLATLSSDREKRRYTKAFDEQLKNDFEEQIKNLSVNQGKVFLKLLDRETGHTSFEILKDLKGGFNAFFYQNAARLFGHDLKSDYNPEGEDKVIESIVLQIESGQINQ